MNHKFKFIYILLISINSNVMANEALMLMSADKGTEEKEIINASKSVFFVNTIEKNNGKTEYKISPGILKKNGLSYQPKAVKFEFDVENNNLSSQLEILQNGLTKSISLDSLPKTLSGKPAITLTVGSEPFVISLEEGVKETNIRVGVPFSIGDGSHEQVIGDNNAKAFNDNPFLKDRVCSKNTESDCHETETKETDAKLLCLNNADAYCLDKVKKTFNNGIENASDWQEKSALAKMRFSVPCNSLTNKKDINNCLASIDKRHIGTCTSFQISKGLFLTNAHCVVDGWTDLELIFGPIQEGPNLFAERAVFSIAKFQGIDLVNHDLDYAIIQATTPIPEKYSNAIISMPLKKDFDKYFPGTLTTLLGYWENKTGISNQRYRVVEGQTTNDCKIIPITQQKANSVCKIDGVSIDDLMLHDCDTTSGGSGSAILSSGIKGSRKLLAIHSGGKEDVSNCSIKISSIVDDLFEKGVIDEQNTF